jgi:hypothetical protein
VGHELSEEHDMAKKFDSDPEPAPEVVVNAIADEEPGFVPPVPEPEGPRPLGEGSFEGED